ncbi:MAG TPA: D-alanine--D-alanine ligase family protein [Patescibacteria group bacterium]|nr:D-alanine--D-alanine ligase family protein [Patescibacteria group bacterium]
MSKLRLGVIFGSRSVEHEVSIITGCQLVKNADREKYEIIPLYVDKTGKWWTKNSLQLSDFSHQNFEDPKGFERFEFSVQPGKNDIDLAIICCHGTLGEDGTVQGLLELANIPYQGPGVVGSAVGMDKIITKKVLEASDIPVVNFQWFTKGIWEKYGEKAVISELLDPKQTGHKLLKFPLFVKPANLGSSVGISKAKNEKELVEAIKVALSFDSRVLVEQGVERMKEINVSVLGYEDYEASVPEEPLSSGEILSYADKYERGGSKKSSGMASLSRRIPAPIPQSFAKKLQDAAINAAVMCDISGVIRVDFITKPETGEFWINELNTIPGSMSFYLWEASGVPYPQLIDRLVEIALKRQADKKGRISSIQTSIIK